MSSVYDYLSPDTTAVTESLCVMLQKESKPYGCCNYLAYSSSVTESDRKMMVDWCYGIIDNTPFDRENVAMAMEMVDRYLSQQNTPTQDFLNDPKQYQLLTMGALYIAIKVNESIAFGSDLLAEISCGAYTVEEIEATELSILHGLGFRLYAPSSFQMAQHILSLIAPHVILRESTWSFILEEVKFGLEYSVRDYFFSTRRPSTVALAAIFNAVDQVDPELFQEFAIVASLVMGSTLATPSELVASKSRLKHLIESEAPKEEDHGVYETPVYEKHCRVKNTQEDPTTKLGEFSASSSIKSVRNAKIRGAMARAA